MASSLSPRFETASAFRAEHEAGSRLAARMRALVHRRLLDSMLADGADPMSSPELALRAERLTAPAYRHKLADGFDDAVGLVERHEPRLTASPPLARREVRAARGALTELSGALRSERRVAPAGVALAQRLLTDGTGPLYLTAEHDGLWKAARRATVALELRA
ncbi:MAG TPA: hypothetical protein VNV44_00455 [Solirubrobacteraceae bacterium]|jgi:hypothetical protein|nr:hypothetical protein [Solirubrobacteraceae bacterium]